MSNFLKNKKVGFYIVAVDILLAVFLGIFFFATYKNFPAGYGGIGMAQNAYANIPEVIGLFMFLGAVIDIVLLILPEFIWIEIFAIAAFCVSLMKQVYCIPNLIADEINKVHYQGGSLPLCLSWLIITIIIIASAIAVLFIGVINSEDEEQLKKEKPAGKKLIKILAGGGAVVATFAVVMSVYGVLAANASKGGQKIVTEKTFAERVKERVVEFQDAVEEYDFNPDEFKLSKADNPYSEMSASDVNKVIGNYNADEERKDADGNIIHKVYIFEGATAEGWQGDYSLKISRITLWEDGLYNGRNTNNGSTVDDLKGYWYNVDDFGEECLILKSTSNSFDMVGNKLTGEGSYYEWFVDVHANYNTQQGGRYIKANGLKYHPLIGMFIDTGSEDVPEYKVGSQLDKSEWTCMQVRNNLAAGSIFDAEHEVTWKNEPNMTEAGEFILTAEYKKEGKNFTADVTIKVVD